MHDWCIFQSIKWDEFIEDISSILDRANKKKNTLWLHGESNSGKTYIATSLQDLCILYHIVPPGSNRFMFQDCISKRLIIMPVVVYYTNKLDVRIHILIEILIKGSPTHDRFPSLSPQKKPNLTLPRTTLLSWLFLFVNSPIISKMSRQEK